MPVSETLPLFPLHTVLLPDAALQLRVFERRYLDMIRDCGRNSSSFGVCLILEGGEVGTPATPAAFGCEAVIEDFDTGADGLLSLRLRGRRRFRVLRSRVRDNGLVIGDVEWREPDPDDELRPEHALLATLLEEILQQASAGQMPALPPAQGDNAAWVAWRLAELLPLDDRQRLAILQEDDPHLRLEQLLALI
ncbi:MAG: LON peptidase substrate-binding domain-containing protein [Pseudoxanthomonas sp.]